MRNPQELLLLDDGFAFFGEESRGVLVLKKEEVQVMDSSSLLRIVGRSSDAIVSSRVT